MNARQVQADEDRGGERLSAFLDGELPSREMREMAARVATDPQARARYERYARIAAHLSGNAPVRVDASGISERVSEALRDEPAVLAPRRWIETVRVPRLAVGAALAAGVAALAVAIAPQVLAPGQVEPLRVLPPEAHGFAFAPRLSVPAEGLRTVALGPGVSAPEGARGHWKGLEPPAREKLARYLLQHSEVAGQIASQQPSSHLGFVSHPNVRP